jgi:four helix bundle protein
MPVTHYRELIAWQKAMNLAVGIYEETRDFPREEIYGLMSQLRRAAVSIPSNIAEGQGRTTTNDFLRFLGMAAGSLQEVETQLILAGRLDYLTEATESALLEQCREVGRLLQGLINALRRKSNN